MKILNNALVKEGKYTKVAPGDIGKHFRDPDNSIFTKINITMNKTDYVRLSGFILFLHQLDIGPYTAHETVAAQYCNRLRTKRESPT